MFLIKLANRTIKYSFYLLFFLVPLIMTPFNYELFEFNKMMLVYALTVVIAAAWLVKMIIAKQFLFRRTPLDIPILFFLISQFLSFLSSIDRHTSLWGYYGRFHGGLLSTISYVTLYYAFVSNIYHLSSIIYHLKIALASGFLVASYGILEHFGIDAQYWVQDVRNRVFSTLGQPNWLAAYLAVLGPIGLAFALSSKLISRQARDDPEQSRRVKAQNFKKFTFYLCLLFTRSRSGFLGFWLANIVFLTLLSLIPFILREFKTRLVFVNLIFLLITFLIGTPFERINRYFTWRGLISPHILHTTYYIPHTLEGGTESGEIRKIVWQGAIDIWRHYPLFGSGQETFAYSYYQFRPKEHNLTSEWDFLYNKAHNEYLNFLATTGLVGLVAYLVFIGGFVAWFMRIVTNSLRMDANRLLLLGLFSGWLSILITNFFGFSVVPIALFFFLIPAISFVLADQTWSRNVDKRRITTQPFSHLTIRQLRISQKFLIFIILSFIFYLLSFIFKLWFADVAYAKGRGLNQLGQYDAALGKLQASIRLNPGEPVYKEEIATSLAHLAFLAYQQKLEVLPDQLAQKAVSFSDQAIEISSYNLNFWKNRAKMFYTLAQIKEEYFQDALMALTTAQMLAPTDAKVAYNLGLVLGQVGENKKAIEVLEKTIELKPDYRNARFALALFYHQAEMDEKAVGELEYILERIASDDVEARGKLKEWRK